MLLVLCEAVRAYCTANELLPSGTFETTVCLVRVAGELLHFYVVVRLAYLVAGVALSRRMRSLHYSGLVSYGLVSAVLLFSGAELDVAPAFLGGAQLWAAGVILTYRARIRDPRLVRFTMHVTVATLVFAPLMPVSVYTGFTEEWLFERMTVTALYLAVVELIVALHAVHVYFLPIPLLRTRDSYGADELRGLSKREWEVVDLLSKGYTNREIAELLAISSKTVTNHLYHIFRKLEVTNRVQLLAELDYPSLDGTE